MEEHSHMNQDLKEWIIGIIQRHNSDPLDTDYLFASAAFGELSKDGLPLDIHIKYHPNEAEIFGHLEVFEDAINDESKFLRLMQEIIQQLYNGGRFQLEEILGDPQYRFKIL